MSEADAAAAGPSGKLAVFLGDWHAQGSSYGGEAQSSKNPHAGETPWTSIHAARWYSGNYFIVQDERANGPFNTMSVLGWDAEAERYFARTIENHGFARDYTMAVDGHVWTLTGEHERATFTFSEDGRTQDVSWEWKPTGAWLPLCDRTASRIG